MEKFDEFLKRYPTKEYDVGKYILEQGDNVSNTYVVLTGLVKVYDISTEGEIKIISFDGKYEAFPVAWTFSKARHVLYFYEGLVKTKVAIIPREDYINFLTSEPEVAFMILNMYVDRYIDFSRRINGLTQLKAEDKVLFALAFLSRRFGGPRTNTSLVRIVIPPLSQQDFADFVGLTRETVSTVLNSLRRKKVIKYRGIEGIEINIKKIEELTEMS